MNLYEILIQLSSPIATPLKGDTLFGLFCWQAAYDDGILEGGLEKNLARYAERPFAVFSSAYPKIKDTGQYAFKRPALPLYSLFKDASQSRGESIRSRKENKGKSWMMVDQNLTIDLGAAQFLSDKELVKLIQSSRKAYPSCKSTSVESHGVFMETLQPHNSINRLTGSTGTGQFAPYSQAVYHGAPGLTLAVLALLDTEVCPIDKALTALERIGLTGFGKDASIGMGRFTIVSHQEVTAPPPGNANALYSLAPCTPAKDSVLDFFFQPFTRFGKHGDRLAARKSPFKTPVIMADEGAVFVPKDPEALNCRYFGRAVGGVSEAISKAMPNTVMQGYSICLPIQVEV